LFIKEDEMGSVTSGFVFSLLAILSNPMAQTVDDRVDLIEVNHYFDESGNPKFDQIIYYRWSTERGRFDVIDYKRLKEADQIPRAVESLSGYLSIWQDSSDQNIIRRVFSQDLIETWTQHDPEMVERRYLPKDRRAELPRMLDVPRSRRR
jgi:hypothetical protein